jgi:hypothetical protein
MDLVFQVPQVHKVQQVQMEQMLFGILLEHTTMEQTIHQEM